MSDPGGLWPEPLNLSCGPTLPSASRALSCPPVVRLHFLPTWSCAPASAPAPSSGGRSSAPSLLRPKARAPSSAPASVPAPSSKFSRPAERPAPAPAPAEDDPLEIAGVFDPPDLRYLRFPYGTENNGPNEIVIPDPNDR